MEINEKAVEKTDVKDNEETDVKKDDGKTDEKESNKSRDERTIEKNLTNLRNEKLVRKILQKKWIIMNTIESFLIYANDTYYDTERKSVIDERLIAILKRQNDIRNDPAIRMDLETTATKHYEALRNLSSKTLNELLHRLDDIRGDVKKMIDLQSVISLTSNPIRDNINQLIHVYEVLMRI